jgi:hypothetical protein
VKGSLGSVVDCCDGAEFDPFRDGVKIGAVVDPKKLTNRRTLLHCAMMGAGIWTA